jgi:hypothetical protein
MHLHLVFWPPSSSVTKSQLVETHLGLFGIIHYTDDGTVEGCAQWHGQ